jgi:hypothetical protein
MSSESHQRLGTTSYYYLPSSGTSPADFAVLDQVETPAAPSPQETADQQVIAGSYNRFSAIENALGSGDYAGALFHLTYTASDEAQAATNARL